MEIHDFKDSVVNLFMYAVGTWLNSQFFGYRIFFLEKGYSMSLIKIPVNIFSFLLLFVLIDFLFYWYHRLSHTGSILDSFHLVHHTSHEMNLTVGARQHWFSYLVSFIFFLPTCLIGFHPLLIKSAITVFHFSLSWYHTKFIRNMGLFEYILMTPSNHRVHHGYNNIYVNKNFGGVLIIWDIIFKTYQKETEAVKYGVSEKFPGYNPLNLQFSSLITYIKNKSG